MRYNGKRGLWWILTLVIYNLLAVWCIVERDKFDGFLICMLALLVGDVFLFILNAKTYVEVKENVLTVVLGLSKLTVNCDKITSIEKTHSPVASMALSFDRLKISYGLDCVYVSVKNNDELIKKLVKINPDIRVV